MKLMRLEHNRILTAMILLVVSPTIFVAQARATTNPPTYSLSISHGSFSPNPLIVDETQPAPGTVTSTATVNGSVVVSNPNSEYQKNNNDQWSYSATAVGYAASDTQGFSAIGQGINAPQVSSSVNGATATITLTANEQTTPGYYEVQVTASDQFTVTDTATSPASTITENPPSVSEMLDATVGDVSISGPTSNIVIGEQVSYTATVAPADLAQGPTYSWNIPTSTSVAVAGGLNITSATYTETGDQKQVTGQVSGHVQPIQTSALTQSSVTFYWVQSGTQTVSCSVLGKTPSIKVSVLGPSVTIQPNPTGGLIGVTANASEVYDGTQTAPGIDLAAHGSQPTNVTGTLTWLQIMKENVQITRAGAPQNWTLSGQGLDTTYPATSVATNGKDFADDPHYPLNPFQANATSIFSDVTKIVLNDSFTTYSMYTPTTDGLGNAIPSGSAIAVPVASIQWTYPETVTVAQDANGLYDIPTLVSPGNGTPPAATGATSSPGWPDWSAIVNADQWTSS